MGYALPTETAPTTSNLPAKFSNRKNKGHSGQALVIARGQAVNAVRFRQNRLANKL
jgi:hypothetical protein